MHSSIPSHSFAIAAALAAAVASTTLHAQSNGPLLALPHVFSVDPVTTLPGYSPDKMLFSNSGVDSYEPPPPPPASASVPDFATFLGGAAVDVDGLSIGYDWVVSTLTGEAAVAPPQWAAITASVTPATTGALGSLIEAEAGAPGGVAADTIGYVIPGSSLPASIVGVPFRSQDAGELNPGLIGAPGNIDAHDIFISLLYLENPQIGATLPPPTVYFTVTAASTASIPTVWTTVPSERSGATVFSTTWDPAGSWDPVVVAYTAGDFGVDPSEDIDAIAIDRVRGTALFSTDILIPPPSGSTRDPLLFTVLGSGANWIYRLPITSIPLSTELGLGLGSDDIDGICSLDPGSAGQPSPIALDHMIGRPGQPLPLGTNNGLATSAWRVLDPVAPAEFATTWMTGWPPPGNPQPSLAISAGSLGGPFGPYVVLDVFVRPQPSNQYEGHPEQTIVQIPTSVSMSGQQLFFIWGALSPATFDTSLPVSIRL